MQHKNNTQQQQLQAIIHALLRIAQALEQLKQEGLAVTIDKP